jgi:hypothetical protein
MKLTEPPYMKRSLMIFTPLGGNVWTEVDCYSGAGLQFGVKRLEMVPRPFTNIFHLHVLKSVHLLSGNNRFETWIW